MIFFFPTHRHLNSNSRERRRFKLISGKQSTRKKKKKKKAGEAALPVYGLKKAVIQQKKTGNRFERRWDEEEKHIPQGPIHQRKTNAWWGVCIQWNVFISIQERRHLGQIPQSQPGVKSAPDLSATLGGGKWEFGNFCLHCLLACSLKCQNTLCCSLQSALSVSEFQSSTNTPENEFAGRRKICLSYLILGFFFFLSVQKWEEKYFQRKDVLLGELF